MSEEPVKDTAPQEQPTQKSNPIFIILLILLNLIGLALLGFLCLLFAFFDGSRLIPYLLIIIISFGTGSISYLLTKKYKNTEKAQLIVNIVMSSLLAILTACANTFFIYVKQVNLVMEKMDGGGAALKNLSLFSDPGTNGTILFVLSIIFFNLILIVKLSKSKQYNKLIWYLIPIIIYALLAIILYLILRVLET